jgi:predicted small lipoprotein YifL
MRRAWLLLALASFAAGGCGQKGPLYLPDKVGKVVTSAPPASPPQTAPTPATPATSAPPGAEPAVAPPPKPTDKDKDQDSQPPK